MTFRTILIISLTFIFLTCGALVNAYAGNDTLSDNRTQTPLSIDVVRGDTLWSIAQEFKPQTQDIRDYIFQLKKLNNLRSSSLQVGQVLMLP